MRMESEELRNLPLHMQEQVGVALAEQMEQAAPVADVPSGIAAVTLPIKGMTYGDYIRQMDDEELADYLVELQVKTIYRVMREFEVTGVENWKKDFTEIMGKAITELCPFE